MKSELIKNVDREALRKLCIEFDKQQGSYPEHEFEGLAFYRFFRELEEDIDHLKWDERLEVEIGIEFEKRGREFF